MNRITPSVKGANFGPNSGLVFGQNINHMYFDLIPKGEGDIELLSKVK